jgi:UDP-N-acetylglucosamine 3-dehydrogenase
MNVGIVGLGIMGNNHKRVYEKLGCTVTDVYDPLVFPDRTLKDFIEGCNHNQVEGISICNPSDQHVSTALVILNTLPEVYLLIEKPISLTISNAKELLPYRDRILVGHIEQFNRGVRQLREWLNDNMFGEIFSIRTKRVNNIPSREPIKNVATDLLVHDIEVVNSIMGRSPTLTKVIRQSTNNNNVYDHAHAILQYDNVVCYCEANWISPVKERYLELYCAYGVVKLDYSKQIVAFTDAQGNIKELLSNDRYEEPLLVELLHFIDCINKKCKPKVSVETGIEVLRVINEDI